MVWRKARRLNSPPCNDHIAHAASRRVYELMCHPGFRVDRIISRLYDYHDWEGTECAVQPGNPGTARFHGIRLIGYRDLVRQDGN